MSRVIPVVSDSEDSSSGVESTPRSAVVRQSSRPAWGDEARGVSSPSRGGASAVPVGGGGVGVGKRVQELAPPLALPPSTPTSGTSGGGSGEDAYIPLNLAKARIAAIVKDMTTMKEQHVAALEEMERNYMAIHTNTVKHYTQVALTLEQQAASRAAKDSAAIAQLEKDTALFKASSNETIEKLRVEIERLRNESEALGVQARADLAALVAERDAAVDQLRKELLAAQAKASSLEAIARKERDGADVEVATQSTSPAGAGATPIKKENKVGVPTSKNSNKGAGGGTAAAAAAATAGGVAVVATTESNLAASSAPPPAVAAAAAASSAAPPPPPPPSSAEATSANDTRGLQSVSGGGSSGPRASSPPPAYKDLAEIQILKEGYDKEIAKLSASIARLESDKTTLTLELATATSSLAACQASLASLTSAYESAVSGAAFATASAHEDSDAAQRRLAAAQARLEDAAAHKEAARLAIATWGKEFQESKGRKPTVEDKRAVKPMYKALETADADVVAAEEALKDAVLKLEQAEARRLEPKSTPNLEEAQQEELNRLRSELIRMTKSLQEAAADKSRALSAQEAELKAAHSKELSAAVAAASLAATPTANASSAKGKAPQGSGGSSAVGGSSSSGSGSGSGSGGVGGGGGGEEGDARVATAEANARALGVRVQELEAALAASKAGPPTAVDTGGSSSKSGSGSGSGGGGTAPVLSASKDAEEARELERKKTAAQLAAALASAASAESSRDSALAELARLKEDHERERVSAAALRDGVSKETTRVGELERQLATFTADLATAKDRVKALEGELAAKDKEGAAASKNLSAELASAREAEKAAGTRAAQAERSLAEATANLEASKATLAATTERALKAEARVTSLESEAEGLRAAAAVAGDTAARLKALEADHAAGQSAYVALQSLFKEEQTKRKALHNKVEDMLGKVRVYARVRPLSATEIQRGNVSCCTYPDEYTIQITRATASGVREFLFDHVFDPTSTQDDVFALASNLVQSAIDGYNVCIFAYGQTGSGKTFTMAGAPGVEGIIPRSFEQIFRVFVEQAANFKYSLKVYMLELYNKKIVDLLTPGGAKANAPDLPIKRDDRGMVYVQGITTRKITELAELYATFDEGCSHRHVGSTKMNAESSRSHLVFSLIIEGKNLRDGKGTIGKLSLVDLAGSEKVGKTEATGDRLKEAQAINASLSALGNVISKLAKGDTFIPYRDDKLTLLMMDSLGGNAKTLMFVNLSPADYNCDESTNSLMYAERVKEIKNDASKNVDSEEVRKLRAQIAKLKAQLGQPVDEGEALEVNESPDLPPGAEDGALTALEEDDRDRDQGAGPSSNV